jgi:hypothetical protein
MRLARPVWTVLPSPTAWPGGRAFSRAISVRQRRTSLNNAMPTRAYSPGATSPRSVAGLLAT